MSYNRPTTQIAPTTGGYNRSKALSFSPVTQPEQKKYGILDKLLLRDVTDRLEEANQKQVQFQNELMARIKLKETQGQDSTRLKKALAGAQIQPSNFTEEISPKALKKQAIKTTKAVPEVLAPAITKFFKTTGSIVGEGLAYAVDDNVRKEYKAGNLDILPTVTKTTQADLAKYTIAAGIETAVYRAFPQVATMKLPARAGAGALEGIGFAVGEGLANDRSPEEIVESLPEYGVGGAIIQTVAPYLLPLLKKEVGIPRELISIFKKEKPTKVEIKEVPIKEKPITVAPAQQKSVTEKIVPGESPELQPLATEARKYKSAEEFVKAQESKYLYHGTNKTTLETIKEQGIVPQRRGVSSLSTNEEYSKNWSDNPWTNTKGVMFRVKKDALKGKTIPSKSGVLTDQQYEILTKETISPSQIEVKTADGWQSLVGNKISPSKSQLTDIWEKAQGGIEIKPRTTEVPREELPVTGEGKTRVSRLEARMSRDLNNPITAQKAEAEGLATYTQMNKKEQIAKASKYVQDNPEEAMAVLRGEKPAPEGLLNNSIALALEKHAEDVGDASLAVRLASLRSTRAGQEISILTEADPSNPINAINEIIKARAEKAVRSMKLKGGKAITEVRKKAKTMAKEGAEQVKQKRIKLAEAESLLDELVC